LDLASGIAVLAAMCLVVCGCCAGGRWWFVRRRRRCQRAGAGKVTVDPTNNSLVYSHAHVVHVTAQA
jgi:hypothetical protein